MIDPIQLVTCVIRPVLKDMGAYSENAERLLLGTACQESECGRKLVQDGDVPDGGRGIYQMEKITFNECVKLLKQPSRLDLYYKVLKRAASRAMGTFSMPSEFDFDEMVGNLYFATAFARVNYMRFPEPIPYSLADQAAYWKTYWNTRLGAGTEEEYVNNWNRFVAHHQLVA